ncbi:MAG: hypothetical protein HKN47_28105 [Pirellulaceae bacterium]|nr:hypothetical protein [Pirellulaceae bacterium]
MTLSLSNQLVGMTSSSHDTEPEDPLAAVYQSRVVILTSPQLVLAEMPDLFPLRLQAAATWDEITDLFSDDRSGCVLVDFDHDRDQTVRELRRLDHEWMMLSVIACSVTDCAETALVAAKAGCVEFAKIPFESRTLLRSIERACKIDSSGEHSPRNIRASLASLTSREREVLRLFLDGINTKLIAKRLGVGYQTIDKHRNRALRKLHCGSLIELANMLHRKW